MRKSYISVLVLIAVIAAGFSPAAGWWVLKRAEKSLKVSVQGQFEPHFFRAAFTVRKAVLTWDKKISLNSGDIKIDYDLFSLVSSGGVRLKISGKALPMKFLEDFSKFSPREQVIVDDFFADLLIGTEGLKEVTALRVKAPEMQFQMGSPKG